MPLYELLVIARCVAPLHSFNRAMVGSDQDLHKKILRTCALHILDSNGVVREFTNIGKKRLPYRMKRHQEIHDRGNYYSMLFDSSPSTMESLRKTLDLHTDVIRHTVIKTGDSLSGVSAYQDPAEL